MGYVNGAFPMGDEDGEVRWYQPHMRAIFPLDTFRPSRSLTKLMKQGKFKVTFDTSFEEVMRGCLRPEDNWINEEIIDVFVQGFRLGLCHSCEVWNGFQLVGGLYGISIGRCFNAESMFHRESNASKVALASMISWCREQGYEIFDAQVMNPHLKSMGAVEVPQAEYMARLRTMLGET